MLLYLNIYHNNVCTTNLNIKQYNINITVIMNTALTYYIEI